MRTRSAIVSWFIAGVILMLPAFGHAQEATLSGTITDSTGGVLPGVTVTAVHEATGNMYESVTDERGGFRMPVRVGTFTISAQLAGFATTNRTVVLLVGQTAAVNIQLAPSQVQETVTVTGQAPLIDTTASTLGSNIDPKQVSELPVLGRSWTDLTLLAVGNRENNVDADAPGLNIGSGSVQIHLDGQQITASLQSCERAASCQQGWHCRVRVHHQPVRRYQGSFQRRTGECHHQVGHERQLRNFFRLFPQ